MRTIMILMDSLNRHYLKAYGDNRIKTPNIDRLAERGIIFDNHYTGSLPCMPARRELWTGRLNFMEAPWGALEPFDKCFTEELRNQKKTYSHMITDHYHYWQWHGLGYNTVFDTWEFLRGQEGDAWHPAVKDPEIPVFRGKNRRQDWVNRLFMDIQRDEDYPTPKCFEQGVEFIENNHNEDNWYLHIEAFDPHEPFMCPEEYHKMYDDNWDNRYHFDWPGYEPVNKELEGDYAIEHIRKSYAAVVTREDVYLGKLLDKMDEYDMWKDTAIILTTDHGHLLGEHGYWAKNYMFDYNELAHIPLIIYMPGMNKNIKRISALTATMDIMPTIMDMFGADIPLNVHGKSLLHLLEKDESHHDFVPYGYFGKDINITDGRYTYCRQPLKDSIANCYTSMPVCFGRGSERYKDAKTGKFLKHADMPVYKINVKSHRHHNAEEFNPTYDLDNDPNQLNPINDEILEKKLATKMIDIMEKYDAPESEFIRVGLK